MSTKENISLTSTCFNKTYNYLIDGLLIEINPYRHYLGGSNRNSDRWALFWEVFFNKTDNILFFIYINNVIVNLASLFEQIW